jgi:hypothetical protein
MDRELASQSSNDLVITAELLKRERIPRECPKSEKPAKINLQFTDQL